MQTLTQAMTPQEKKELFLTELENRIIKQLGDKLHTRFETCLVSRRIYLYAYCGK